MNDPSAFLFGNNSTAMAMNALQAAAAVDSKNTTGLSYYPYSNFPRSNITTASGIRNTSQSMMTQNNGTPFGINDILSRPLMVSYKLK